MAKKPSFLEMHEAVGGSYSSQERVQKEQEHKQKQEENISQQRKETVNNSSPFLKMHNAVGGSYGGKERTRWNAGDASRRKKTASGLIAEDADALRKQRNTYQSELDTYLASDAYKEKEQRAIAIADIASFNSGTTIQPIEDSKLKDLREKIADIDTQLKQYDRIDAIQDSRITPLKGKTGFSTAREDYNSTAAQRAASNSQVSQRMAENQQEKDNKISTLTAQRDAAQAELDAWVASEEYQKNLRMLGGNKDFKYSAAERKKKRLQNKIADLEEQIAQQEQEELPGASKVEKGLLTDRLDALTRNRTPDEYQRDPEYQATLAAYSQAETEEDNLGAYLDWYEALSDQDKEKLLNGNYNPQAVDNREFVRSQPGDTGKHWERMTEDEINAYYYIANTEGMAAAKEFLEELQTTLDWRHTTARETATQEQMEESSLVGNMLRGVGTVAGQVIAGPMAFASDVVNTLQGKDFNPYSNAHYLQNIIGVTRSAAANDVQAAVAGDGSSPFWNAMGQVAANAYQAGLSTLDSLMGMGAMGSTYTAGMGMGAAASRMRELYESGATDQEIYFGAIGSGILEALFEKVSLEYFTEDFIKANPEKWIKKMLLSAPPAIPDWDEQDSTAGGFIKNKPDVLLRTGGSMTGNLSMNGNAITDVKDPEKGTDVATKSYVDAKHLAAEGTLLATGWSGSAPYTQAITVAGLLATDAPHVSPVYSDTTDTAIAQQEAWGVVNKAVAEVDSITFTCFEEKPEVDIPIHLEVNR